MAELTADTFVLTHRYRHSPEKVFAAFANADQKRLWFAEGPHHQVEEFHFSFHEGGQEIVRSRFGETSPFPGVALVTEGLHQHIVPGELIVMQACMYIGNRRISVAQASFAFAPVDGGTELTLTHQAFFFAGSDGPALRRQGWVALFQQLENALA